MKPKTVVLDSYNCLNFGDQFLYYDNYHLKDRRITNMGFRIEELSKDYYLIYEDSIVSVEVTPFSYAIMSLLYYLNEKLFIKYFSYYEKKYRNSSLISVKYDMEFEGDVVGKIDDITITKGEFKTRILANVIRKWDLISTSRVITGHDFKANLYARMRVTKFVS